MHTIGGLLIFAAKRMRRADDFRVPGTPFAIPGTSGVVLLLLGMACVTGALRTSTTPNSWVIAIDPPDAILPNANVVRPRLLGVLIALPGIVAFLVATVAVSALLFSWWTDSWPVLGGVTWSLFWMALSRWREPQSSSIKTGRTLITLAASQSGGLSEYLVSLPPTERLILRTRAQGWAALLQHLSPSTVQVSPLGRGRYEVLIN